MSLQVKCVEFVGGPIDGYLEVIDCEAIACTSLIRLNINENIILALGGERPSTKRPPTSVAFYERIFDNQAYRYHYLGSTYPNDPFDSAEWI